MQKFIKLFIFLIFYSSFSINKIYSDSFKYNTYNNHGIIGLINIPSARFHEAGSYGINAYYGTPDQKVTITSSPYDWLEASLFYSNIEENPINCNFKTCRKDKGFNFKIRLKEEGVWPGLAIGINDIGGTGLYNSEYLVASYGINKLDMHFGIGWGALNGEPKLKNPLTLLNDSFKDRPTSRDDQGGAFQPNIYFSSEEVTPFFGMSYAINPKILIKIEKDPTSTPGNEIGYEISNSRTSFGFEYLINESFSLGLSAERDNYISFKFSYKQNVLSSKKPYEYKKIDENKDDNYIKKLVKNLESNGIGVNKIFQNGNDIGLEVTQFNHSSLDIVEEIIMTAKGESGTEKAIKVDYRVADLQAYSEFDDEFIKNAETIYNRPEIKRFSTNNRITVRPFIAAREDFIKLAVLLQNDSEYIIKDNFFFSSNLKYSIWDNFDDLIWPPVDTYPAQVRSDVKDYLNNFDQGVIIGRAQFDYHITPKKYNHIMFTSGILEEMFAGYGFEYLYFDNKENYAIGLEIFDVVKRDYKMRFGTTDYKNTVGSINFYYRNYKFLPFDAKISYGEYLAGDVGTTFELSRSYINGTRFGVFATMTDVTSEQFGEGSFDKGIFFNIPIAGGIGNYTGRPLTKDPGAKLIRKHTLYDLLVKFKPYNN